MDPIADRYLRFAKIEATGRSPLYEKWALHVANSFDALAFLQGLPVDKQQPNLLFAAFRHTVGAPASTSEFDAGLAQHGGAIRALMLARSTQTNEPGRCAVLLPALASIRGKIALIEVGASAGLCLLMDKYGYDWGFQRLVPCRDGTGYPVYPCEVTGAGSLPHTYPEIVWRAGLDLSPIDVHCDEDRKWLEDLVWPEDGNRLGRLQSALRICRREPPQIVRGDLLRDLASLIEQAPAEATVVVYHSAVLNYVMDQALRNEFARNMLASRCVWISNESPLVFPQFLPAATPQPSGMFLLCANGHALAWTDPHGLALQWL
ncbi:DUF2332 domain-containing protein [Achromobacter animicus]|uniref:DUF2332 domain-containing protein n=1 Tax=Achromobacter animicus TaxID=1389935 RepID=UPI0015826443|nr:DUF2332 domain-containing protein [Achromobacter animicus]